jgi:hypothetical protein
MNSTKNKLTFALLAFVVFSLVTLLGTDRSRVPDAVRYEEVLFCEHLALQDQVTSMLRDADQSSCSFQMRKVVAAFCASGRSCRLANLVQRRGGSY